MKLDRLRTIDHRRVAIDRIWVQTQLENWISEEISQYRRDNSSNIRTRNIFHNFETHISLGD
jgi:hypothetical protein